MLGYPPATSFFRVEGRWKAKIHRCLDDLDGFRMDFWMENGSDDSDGVLCIHFLGGVIAVIIITIIMIIRYKYIYIHYITLHLVYIAYHTIPYHAVPCHAIQYIHT